MNLVKGFDIIKEKGAFIMADTLIKFKTGTATAFAGRKTVNNVEYPTVPLESGSVYFVYDTSADPSIGRIAYDIAIPQSAALSEWSSGSTYALGAKVAYNGKNYISLASSNVNKKPFGATVLVDSYDSYTYWAEIAERIIMDTQASHADFAEYLDTARAIDGVQFNGSSAIVHYGVCETAAATQEKEVTCTGFVLDTGARIIVRYVNSNSHNSPLLKIKYNETNYTAAKPIYYKGAAIAPAKLAAGDIHEYVYDSTVITGGAWVYIGTTGSDLNIAVDHTTNTLVIGSPISSGDGVRY